MIFWRLRVPAVVHLWLIAALAGLLASVAGLATHASAPVGDVLNLVMFVLLCALHGVNAVRTRRRRSVLLFVPFAMVAMVGTLAMIDRVAVRWDDLLVMVVACWLPAAAADVVFPESIYLRAPLFSAPFGMTSVSSTATVTPPARLDR